MAQAVPVTMRLKVPFMHVPKSPRFRGDAMEQIKQLLKMKEKKGDEWKVILSIARPPPRLI